MNKQRMSIFSLLILSVALATGFMFSTATGGQQMKKSDCELACRKTYDECLRAPNADQTTCKAALNSCLAGCKSKPSPSPSPMVSPAPEPSPSPSPMVSPAPEPSPSPEMEPSPSPTASPTPPTG